MNAPFHLSLPCLDIEATKKFYVDRLGADLGRIAQNWLDINLFGNQITFTKSGKFDFSFQNYSFEGKILPSFHYGIIVSNDVWEKLYAKVTAQQIEVFEEITFLKDKKGEHTSFFVKDPNDYMVEFKTFKNNEDVFKAD
ncbi:bleomycin resistance protein [Aureibaculum sp. 2210JD6-5]|uniref:VOC family protein n=1 Tax=Aureibaculum sp. 2210JD6-5 TaxID=3103957 RepID=UPI002AAC81DA|nr:VOC family protein [Aureibaculum sp. 2210JD6-5]MDY7393620.1 bleomycin resistance protein [Aureibaculum sp. 2210JD6-5]